MHPTLLVLVVAATCWLQVAFVKSFCPPPRLQARQAQASTETRLYNQLVNKTLDATTASTGTSNFWYTTNYNNDDDDSKKYRRKAPVVRSLDADGPLPPVAYHILGQEQFQPKPSCSLVVSLHLNPSDDMTKDEPMNADQMIASMLQCVGAGLSTFQLGLPATSPPKLILGPKQKQDVVEDDKALLERMYSSDLQAWGEEHVYGKLHRTTPRSVLEQFHLVVPFMTPSAFVDNGSVNRKTIRQSITESLSRMGAESIDTLQLECKLEQSSVVCCCWRIYGLEQLVCFYFVAGSKKMA